MSSGNSFENFDGTSSDNNSERLRGETQGLVHCSHPPDCPKRLCCLRAMSTQLFETFDIAGNSLRSIRHQINETVSLHIAAATIRRRCFQERFFKNLEIGLGHEVLNSSTSPKFGVVPGSAPGRTPKSRIVIVIG